MSNTIIDSKTRTCMLCEPPLEFDVTTDGKAFAKHMIEVHGYKRETVFSGNLRMAVDGSGFAYNSYDYRVDDKLIFTESINLVSPKEAEKRRKQRAATKAAAATPAPDINAFKTWMNNGHNTAPAQEWLRGVVVNHLDEVCGTELRRRELLMFLYGVNSSKLLNDVQLHRLYEWLGPHNIGTEEEKNYVVREQCYLTALAVLGEPNEQMTIDDAADTPIEEISNKE